MNRVVLALSLTTVLLAGCRPFVDSYESCAFSADCIEAGETCAAIFNGSGRADICTTTCVSDADCPIDSTGDRGVCSTAGGTSSPICLQRCLSDVDCFGTRICGLGGVCLPRPGTTTGTVPNYRSCFASSDCRSAPECVRFNVGGVVSDICSRTGCRSDDDCPIDARGGRGACLSFDGGTTRACWERCNFRADCEDTVNWDCTTSVGGFMVPPPGVCAPR